MTVAAIRFPLLVTHAWWEQVLLEEYEAKYGRLPRENRVRGFVASPGDE